MLAKFSDKCMEGGGGRNDELLSHTRAGLRVNVHPDRRFWRRFSTKKASAFAVTFHTLLL